MQRNTDRILTTHPGRLPNPTNMAAVQAAKAGGDKAAFESETKTGIAQMIARQKQIGIDIMSDGEFWKGRNQAYYDSRVTGITSMPLQPGQSPSLTHDLRERTSPEFKAFYDAFDKVGNAPMPGVVNPPASVRWAITSEVKSQGDAAIKDEIALVTNALEAAGEKKENFFFPVLGPGWLDHFVMNDFYRTEEEYVYAMALVAKADFKAVADAGFVLQIDDPGLVDTWAMLSPAPSVEDYRKRIQLRVEATNWALEGVDEDMIRFHTCWGSWHTPHVTDLPLKHTVDIMLQVKAAAYSIEAADVQHELDYQVWQETKFPDGKVFIPGVIAHKTSTVEPPELVAHRLVQYANIMGKENVIAGVDCGVGGRCYPDIGWAKLKALADGAAMASKQLWK